jgi:hypothetical protein
MPKYPPRNEPIRKIQVLEKAVIQLIKSIRNNDASEKQLAGAEKVRSAQLNLIKTKLALLIPYRAEDVSEIVTLSTLKLNNEYLEWERKSIEEIIDGYR